MGRGSPVKKPRRHRKRLVNPPTSKSPTLEELDAMTVSPISYIPSAPAAAPDRWTVRGLPTPDVGADARVGIERVDPDTARHFLTKMRQNRAPSQVKIDQFARDMLAGNWHLNGETLKFDINGVFFDGNHRCLAVIQSGKAQDFFVARGLAPEAFRTVDTGTPRGMKHVLQMEGVDNSAVLAAIARQMWAWENGVLQVAAGRLSPSHTELEDVLARHPDLSRAATISGLKGLSRLLPPSVIGACWYILARVDDAEATAFFQALSDGAGLARGNPILTLRERLITDRTQRRRNSTAMYYDMVFRAWNAHRKGRQLSKIQLSLPLRDITTPL